MSSPEDVAEVLIAEIQARPALWNTKLASYKNRNVRDRLYAEVGEILGISKAAVAARWKNKKDKYRRELKKIPVSYSGDAANNYTSNWPYFEMMSFLKDTLTPAVKSGNLPTFEQSQDDGSNSDVEGEKDDIADTQSVTDPTESSLLSPSSVSGPPTPSQEERPSSVSASSTTSQQGKGNRKRLCDVRDAKFLEIENKKLHLLAQTLTHDADKPESEELHFFKSLIPYMEKFTPVQKLTIRNKIQEVILNGLLSAENGGLDIGPSTSAQNNNLTFTSPKAIHHQTTLPPDTSTSYLPYAHQYQYQ